MAKMLKNTILLIALLTAVQTVKIGAMQDKLEYAINLNNLKAAEEAIKNGADVNAMDKYDNFPLNVAIEKENLAIVTLLIKNGADVNAMDKYDNLPLNVAIRKGNLAIVTLLIKNGAKGGDENISLNIAIHQGNIAIIKLLIENGADVGVYKVALHLTSNESIRNYIEMVRYFYAVNEAQKTFTDFTDKYLSNNELLKANLTDITNLLPLATARFVEQLMSFMRTNELPDLLGQKKLSWLLLELFKTAPKDKKTYWLREALKYLDEKPTFMHETKSVFDQAVADAIKTLPEKDRAQLTKEMNMASLQKKTFETQETTKKPKFSDIKIVYKK